MMHADRNMIFDILLLNNSEIEKRKSSSFSIFDLSCQDNHHLKTATPLRNQGTHKLSTKNSQSYTRGHPIKPAKITTSAQEQPNNYFPIIRRIDL